MLPISVGLPLILSGKKRPQRRRLEPEPARPRGGSAPAGFAGRAVADPALPAHSQGPAVGTTRFPRERLRAAACRTGRERRAVDERRTASRPGPAPLRPARPRGPAAPRSSPGKSCGGATRAAPGPEGWCGACASGRATWPLPEPSRLGPCVLEAQRLIPIKPNPRRKELWFGDEA